METYKLDQQRTSPKKIILYRQNNKLNKFILSRKVVALYLMKENSLFLAVKNFIIVKNNI